MKCLLNTSMALLVGTGLLSACNVKCHTEKSEFEMAVSLGHSGGGYNPLPHDAWTENPELELFLREALKTEGMISLAAKHSMQCIRPNTGCDDCLTCRTTLKQETMGSPPPPIPFYRCVDWGEVLVQVDTGPGASIKAMTYWRTTPDGRDFLVRQARRHAQPPPIYVPPLSPPSAPSGR